jgi:hypothetical protein
LAQNTSTSLKITLAAEVYLAKGQFLLEQYTLNIRRGADKFLAFPICSTTKLIFLGWVKEVRTTKS